MEIDEIFSVKYLMWVGVPIFLYFLERFGYVTKKSMSGTVYYCLLYYSFFLFIKYTTDMGRSQSNQLISYNLHFPIARGDEKPIDKFIIRRDCIDIPLIPRMPLNSITVVYLKKAQRLLGENIAVNGIFRRAINLNSLPYAVARAIVYNGFNTKNIWIFRFHLKNFEDKFDSIATIEEEFDAKDYRINAMYELLRNHKRVVEEDVHRSKRIADSSKKTGFFRSVRDAFLEDENSK